MATPGKRFLCLDVEAVTDSAVWRAPEDNPELFGPPFSWRPIVIGCVLIEEVAQGLAASRVGAIEVPKEGDPDRWEATLLEKFAQTVRALGNVDVVTWNGRGFDMPVLMLRCLRYGIAHPWYYRPRDARYRYSEDLHLDLADHMADNGACRQALSLDGMARLIGLPGKFGDIDGAGVGQAFAAGRHQDIATYCITDAVSLAFLFLRWHLLKGTLSPEWYRAGAATLIALCDAQERLKPFCAAIDRRVALLEEPAAAPAAATPTPEAA